MILSIIIPAYNEDATIAEILRRVIAAPLAGAKKEIIVVDDASSDHTAQIAGLIPGVRVIRHAQNTGKGGAVKSGIAAATGDLVIIQDADLEYSPDDYQTVIQPLLDGQADAVMGSRFLHERPVFFGKRRSPYFLHYAGNLSIIAVTNFLYRRSFTDYEGCYKAFVRPLLLRTPVEANGFEFDNELICKIMRTGARIVEVPIHYRPRTYERGKKITWRHGLIMLWTIVKWRWHPIAHPAALEQQKLAA